MLWRRKEEEKNIDNEIRAVFLFFFVALLFLFIHFIFTVFDLPHFGDSSLLLLLQIAKFFPVVELIMYNLEHRNMLVGKNC